ncbi:MAG: hypothetical protein EOO16_07955 [Chitinophagaceae bacterium]|nr:MAG: hypothetical protein EOO16_07955 [Chitinophagaceae bacterium]
MFKLILLGLAVGAYFFRMQSRKASRNAQNTTRAHARKLAGGNFEAVAAELDMQVRQKSSATFSVELLYGRLKALKGKAIAEKFHLADLRRGDNGDLLLLADGKTTELVPGRGGNELIDRFYSCCLYVHADADENIVRFRSSFPDDKEHQYLLEDLSDHLFDMGREEPGTTTG